MRFVVWGAPCSGKTTYVNEHAKAGDVICDYDALYQAISGLPKYERSESLQGFMKGLIAEFYSLIEKNPELDAWIVTAARDRNQAEELAARFDAELIEFRVSRETAHERCDADKRPAEWHEAIDKWFDATAKGQVQKMEKKLFDVKLELKQDSEGKATGEFEAIFAYFDVIDKQGDVTEPGAFTEGQKVKIAAWGHDWYKLPVGKGVIHQDGEKAWVDGKFFLDTEGGRETYQTVKNLEELQEWSYGFEVLESGQGEVDGDKVRILRKLSVFEVSPVFIGAGNGTQTTVIKGEGEMPPLVEEPDQDSESETVESGNESGVDPVELKFLIEIIERTHNDGK
mgnify:CR=1 FL=1